MASAAPLRISARRRGRRRSCASAAVNGTNVAQLGGRRARAAVAAASPARRSSALRASRRPARQWAASASSARRHARARQELAACAVAERDRAGLVEQQRVDVAGGLDRAARLRDAHWPAPAGPCRRCRSPTGGRRWWSESGAPAARPGPGDRRPCCPSIDRERPQGDDDDQEDHRQRRPAGCPARSRSASSGAWRLRPCAIMRSRKLSPGSGGDAHHDPVARSRACRR